MSHAIQRAFERCPGVCAPLLVKTLRKCVVNKRDDLVAYIGMTTEGAFSALYRFRYGEGKDAYAIADTCTGYVITILPPDGFSQLRNGCFDRASGVFLSAEARALKWRAAQ